MSGALVLEHRRILNELAGPERFARALAKLSPDVRREYEETSPVSWPAVTVVESVMNAVAGELGEDPVALHTRVSRESLDRTMTTLWRLLLRFTTDEAIISRSPLLYARAFDRGRLEARIVAPGRGEIRVLGWPDIPEFSLRGTRLAIESVLRIAGRQDVQIVTDRDVDGPRFLATWRA